MNNRVHNSKVCRVMAILEITENKVFENACNGMKTRHGWCLEHNHVFEEYCHTGILPLFVNGYCDRVIEEYMQPKLPLFG